MLKDQLYFYRIRCVNLEAENKRLRDANNFTIECNKALSNLVDADAKEIAELLSTNRSLMIDNAICLNALALHGIQIFKLTPEQNAAERNSGASN